MLLPSSGYLNWVQMDAEVIGRRKCVDYTGRFRRLWTITATEREEQTRSILSSFCSSDWPQYLQPSDSSDVFPHTNHFTLFSHPAVEAA
jgi:hypothetical protein